MLVWGPSTTPYFQNPCPVASTVNSCIMQSIGKKIPQPVHRMYKSFWKILKSDLFYFSLRHSESDAVSDVFTHCVQKPNKNAQNRIYPKREINFDLIIKLMDEISANLMELWLQLKASSTCRYWNWVTRKG